MGKLQPSGTPGRPIMARGSRTPPKPENKPEKCDNKPCDSCGYSTIDGQPIAYAKARVYVRNGTLYLCGHHLKNHLPYLLECGYYFRSLV